eukprot:Amastigsp_a11861_8.p2 type:complete len:157 gc:universal Amastigsp_a11861_8:253-723(+)
MSGNETERVVSGSSLTAASNRRARRRSSRTLASQAPSESSLHFAATIANISAPMAAPSRPNGASGDMLASSSRRSSTESSRVRFPTLSRWAAMPSSLGGLSYGVCAVATRACSRAASAAAHVCEDGKSRNATTPLMTGIAAAISGRALSSESRAPP